MDEEDEGWRVIGVDIPAAPLPSLSFPSPPPPPPAEKKTGFRACSSPEAVKELAKRAFLDPACPDRAELAADARGILHALNQRLPVYTDCAVLSGLWSALGDAWRMDDKERAAVMKTIRAGLRSSARRALAAAEDTAVVAAPIDNSSSAPICSGGAAKPCRPRFTGKSEYLLAAQNKSMRRTVGASMSLAAASSATSAAAGPVPTWRLLETYRVPNGNARQAWLLYCVGDTASGCPPLQLVLPSDITNLNAKKRFCEFRALMRRFRARVEERGLWVEEPTAMQAEDMFDAAQAAVEVPVELPHGWSKQPEDLDWLVLARKLAELQREKVAA